MATRRSRKSRLDVVTTIESPHFAQQRAPGSDMNVDGSVTAVLDCFEDGAETRGVDE